MPRYMAFDLETVDPFPEDRNWREVRPLGIGCAAAYASDLRAPIFWCERNEQGGVEERMSPDPPPWAITQRRQRESSRSATPMTWRQAMRSPLGGIRKAAPSKWRGCRSRFVSRCKNG